MVVRPKRTVLLMTTSAPKVWNIIGTLVSENPVEHNFYWESFSSSIWRSFRSVDFRLDCEVKWWYHVLSFVIYTSTIVVYYDWRDFKTAQNTQLVVIDLFWVRGPQCYGISDIWFTLFCGHSSVTVSFWRPTTVFALCAHMTCREFV